jgi:hypothetical protein
LGLAVNLKTVKNLPDVGGFYSEIANKSPICYISEVKN